MANHSATAVAHPNIALIKYWGNRDQALRIPSNGSISLTLAGMQTRTSVRFDNALADDRITIDGECVRSLRVRSMLDLVRELSGERARAEVDSQSDFPTGVGLASSAAAFAALSLAATRAAGLELDSSQLSALARRGSGSASRSVHGGYVELLAGGSDDECIALPIADPGHWELVDLIAVVSQQPKTIDSTAGHARADTSPIQTARVQDAPRRLQACRQAILERDFARLAEVAEQDSDLMHAVMMTSQPGVHYWLPATLEVMAAVRELRLSGIEVFYTVDAGPNVHCLCQPGAERSVRTRLEQIPGTLQIYRGTPGWGARVV